MRETVIETLAKSRLLVVVRGYDRADCLRIAGALVRGGVSCLEIAYRADRPETDEETAAVIAAIRERFGGPGGLTVGAGTVLTPEQVTLTAQAGGELAVSPVTDPAVIHAAREAGLAVIAGAMTPTECLTAYRAGADFIKLFPASALGPSYLSALLTPLDRLRVIAVGGVTLSDLGAWLDAGACGVGISSGIVDRRLVAAGDDAALTARARQYTEAIAARGLFHRI